jgi:DNA segregation ATPase FtsK/SpoIIIE, S-DNA-T family
VTVPALLITLWDPASAAPIGDVELTVWPQTPIASVAACLPGALSGLDLYVGSQRLDPGSTFADSPIVAGSYLSCGAPGPGSPVPVNDPAGDQSGELAGILTVMAGPDRGRSFVLAPGYHEIARRDGVSVLLTDPEVTRRGHARLTAAPSGRLVAEDLGSGNGTYVDDSRLTEPRELRPGEHLRTGTSTLRWHPRPSTGLQTERSAEGVLHFDRSFAVSPYLPELCLQLPSWHEPPRLLAGMLIPLALPLLAAGLMAVLLHQPAFLLLALLGPIGALGTWLVEGRQRAARRRERDRQQAQVQRTIAGHLLHERAVREEGSPGQTALVLAATGMSTGLWPRNADAHDALVVRVGTASQHARVSFDGTPWPGLEQPVLADVPVTVDLRVDGVLAVAGPAEQTAALARWLIIQLATLRSPGDLRLVVLSAGDGAGLAWTRWLPHLAGGESAGLPCWVGNTEATRRRRAAELRDLIAQRHAPAIKPGGRDATGGSQPHPGDVVVILDGALALRETPGMQEILRDGPSAGVYSICVDSSSMNESTAECRLESSGALTVTHSRTGTSITAVPESCDPALAERIARSLAPLRDRLSLSAATGSIPCPVRFLDLLSIPGKPSADQVRSLWQAHTGPVTDVPICVDAEGVVRVDLAAQGPHTMLGGATGSGKSFLLQTLITSLLLHNSPAELNLVLVDFKGGSAFLDFERCPHVVSLIRSTGETAADVFDEAAATRMLASVRTEVGRREALLARFGGEIDAYWQARSAQPALAPLPRLVLVFDEFARVLDTAPAFLRELVNVAGKGRSLGMHLVLATQSLQGKLSPELKNNIDLRITLRQNEAADSTEVLGVPDAATIPGRLRGRGLLVCTKDDQRAPRPFQAGFLGAPPPRGGPPPASLRPVTWSSAGLPAPSQLEQREAGQREAAQSVTDQEWCIRAIEAASQGSAPPFRPLLPPLPPQLPLATVGELSTTDLPPTVVAFGLADDPRAQAQPALGLDLAGTERVLVAGGPQQGRTTFARTLVHGLASRFGVGQVHLYLIEREPGGLQVFHALPQCGGVMSGREPDRLRRFGDWLAAELERRRTARLSGGLADDPKIVVIVDGWEQYEHRSDPAFAETSLAGTMRAVIAAGVTVGIHVVVIGGQDLLNGTVPTLFQRRLVLPFPKDDVRRQHLPPGTACPALLPGRAVDGADGRHVQLCHPSMSDQDLVALCQARAESGPEADLPVAIPPLPQAFSSAELSSAGQAARWVPLGLGGPAAQPCGVDLFGSDSHLMLISGPRRSGRTTALSTLLAGLLSRQVPVLLLPGGRSALNLLDDVEGQLEVLPGTVLHDADLRAAADRLGPDHAVLVDDCHALTVEAATVDYLEQPTLLAEICQSGAARRALVLAGDAGLILSGHRRALARVVHEMLTGHRLLLTPSRALDAREQGFELEADQLFSAPAGRGYLSGGRTATLIQVATSDWPEASGGALAPGPGGARPSARSPRSPTRPPAA